MTRPLTIAGKPSRELHAPNHVAAYSMQPVRGLKTPASTIVTNAGMPNAGQAYPWPHLQAPARVIRGQA